MMLGRGYPKYRRKKWKKKLLELVKNMLGVGFSYNFQKLSYAKVDLRCFMK